MKQAIMSMRSAAQSAVFGVSALALSAGAADAAVVLNMNFNHGVMSPAETPYVAGAGEVLDGTYTSSGGSFFLTSFANTPSPKPGYVSGGQAYYNTGQNASNVNHSAYHTTNHPEITGSFTIEFLYRPSVVNQLVQQLFYSSTSTYGTETFLDVNDNKVRFSLYGGLATQVSTASLQADQWYHIALVYNEIDGQNRLYIDGQLDTTQNFGANPAFVGIDNDFYLLGTPNFGNRNINGYVDGIALSDQALVPGSFVLEVPEPTMGALFGGGLVLLMRRRQST